MTDGSTPDVLFGGRLRLLQQRTGHRVGTDAVLLAAAAGVAKCVADLGSGVGPVGLGLLALGRAGRAVLVERDPGTATRARDNIALNGMEEKACVVEVDITARAATLRLAGLEPGMADLVVCNPPFNEPGRHRASPDALRAAAHEMAPEQMEVWAKAAARVLCGGGRLVMIHRPEALPWLLPMLAARFGALGIKPVHPAPGQPANRVLIGARLNSKAPAHVLPALVLRDAGGTFTSEVSALHAGEASLAM